MSLGGTESWWNQLGPQTPLHLSRQERCTPRRPPNLISSCSLLCYSLGAAASDRTTCSDSASLRLRQSVPAASTTIAPSSEDSVSANSPSRLICGATPKMADVP